MTPQGPYDDLIELPRPPSRYPKMPHSERAARFSPFAALSGHAAAVSEAARHTEERPIPEADAAECLDACLRYVLGSTGRTARFTWFVPAPRKPGGSRRTVTGSIRHIDPQSDTLILRDGTRIPIRDLLGVSPP